MSLDSDNALLVQLLFDFGLIDGPAVIDWADAQIVALASPPSRLIELSTTPVARTADLLSHLSALALGADYWDAFRALLGLLYEGIALHPERTQLFNNEVYSRLVRAPPVRAIPSDLPSDLEFFYTFGDKLDLARRRIFGDFHTVVHEYLAHLQAFERFKRVPSGLVLEDKASSEWPIALGQPES
jgi:hypothetical protein